MSQTFSVTAPADGQVIYHGQYADQAAINTAVAAAKAAQSGWRQTPLAERKAKVAAAIDWLVAHRDDIARTITAAMGRPIGQSPGEVRGLEERARHMLAIADEALADVVPAAQPGFKRFLRREPLGTVLVMAPWNYPFLTAVNAIVPALVAGNTVLLKHSSQTPQVAEWFQAAFAAAGLPAGVFQILFLSHADTEALLHTDAVDFVAFTGSVGGGKQVQAALS